MVEVTSVSRRLSVATLVALCATELAALAALVGPLVIGLQLRAYDVSSSLVVEARLSWAEGAGAAAAMIANPAFGWLSDRYRQRTGSRAAWIVLGAVGGLGALWCAATASTLAGLVVAWCCAQAAYNATFAALYGTIADLVAPEDRSRVSGWFAGAAMGALVFGSAFAALLVSGAAGDAAKEPTAVLTIGAWCAVPVAVVSAWHIHRVARGSGAPVRRRAPDGRSASRAAGSSTSRAFWWLWAQRLLAQTAYGFTTVYGVFVLIRRAGLERADAALVVALTSATSAALAMMLAMLVARRAAERFGARVVLGAGVGAILVANLLLAATVSVPGYVVASLCAGCGLGLYASVDLAAALAVAPRGAEGRYLGIFNAARTLPQTLVPVIGPFVLALGSDALGRDRSQNYLAFFAVGTVVAVAALALLGRLTLPGRDGRIAPSHPGESR